MLVERLNILITIMLVGPCYAAPRSNKTAVSYIITPAFFNAIINEAEPGCAGKKFFTRSPCLEALVSFPSFGTDDSLETSKHEIAAFFAHATHETGHFCFVEEIDGASKNYCDNTNKQYSCKRGKKYHGRGPIQLSWNYNYGRAGKVLCFDGLNKSEMVKKTLLQRLKPQCGIGRSSSTQP